jgi:hypothetical protein
VLNGAAVTVRNSTIDGSKRLDGPAAVADVSKHSSLTMYDSVVKGGAAVVVTDSKLALHNCSLVGNTAQGPYTGGAVHLAANSSFTATATTFRDNSAALGGAVMAMLLNDVSLVDCSFVNNSAQYGSGSRGGAISLQASNNLTATRTTFRSNSADVGGAIAGIGTNEVLLQGCTFATNAASDSGGAVYMTNPAYTARSQCDAAAATSFGNLSMTACSFQGNTAGSAGGAAFVNNGINVASRLALFGSNNVTSGAGGAVVLGEGGTWLDANSIYSSNRAAKGGAAQVLQDAAATFSACAFSGNNASEGGAVQVDAGAVALEGGSLTGNVAWKGGAILARRAAKVALSKGVEVVGNRAAQFGGGIVLDSECNQQVRRPGGPGAVVRQLRRAALGSCIDRDWCAQALSQVLAPRVQRMHWPSRRSLAARRCAAPACCGQHPVTTALLCHCTAVGRVGMGGPGPCAGPARPRECPPGSPGGKCVPCSAGVVQSLG